MINVGGKRNRTKEAGMPLLLSGRFRWATAVQRLRETNRRAAGLKPQANGDDDSSNAALWGEGDKG